MSKKIKLFVLFLSMCNVNTISAEEIDTTDLVNDAKNLCVAISTSGWTESYVFKGDAKVELDNIFKKIGLEVGAGGSVDITNNKYSGVFQKDLAKTIEDGNSCRLKAFEMLKDIKLKSLESTKAASKDELVRSQLRGCLSGNILDCRKIQAKFDGAQVDCNEYVNTLKINVSSEEDGFEVFSMDRYCGNMKSTAASMVALLQNMYRECAVSLSSDKCNTNLRILRSSFTDGPRPISENGIVEYLSKYSD